MGVKVRVTFSLKRPVDNVEVDTTEVMDRFPYLGRRLNLLSASGSPIRAHTHSCRKCHYIVPSCLYMRTQHRRTLQRIFIKPTPGDIRWAEIESMLRAAGVEIRERAGSRIVLIKGNERMVAHRPHPRPEAGKMTVRMIAAFLENVGVTP